MIAIFRFLMVILAAFGQVAMATGPQVEQAAREIKSAAGDHRLIVLGELHGTREIPALMSALVSNYSEREPVVLALEVSRSEHAAISAYLASDGGHAAHEALLSSGYWHVPASRHDGRRTEEMLELIEATRKLRVRGRDVAIYPFDVVVSGRGSEIRDQAMASYLRQAHKKLAKGRLLVLTGNVHAMLRKSSSCQQCQTPMTSYLLDLNPYSIDVKAKQGTFLGCAKECGPMSTQSASNSGPLYEGSAYSYRYVLPEFTQGTLIQKP